MEASRWEEAGAEAEVRDVALCRAAPPDHCACTFSEMTWDLKNCDVFRYGAQLLCLGVFN